MDEEQEILRRRRERRSDGFQIERVTDAAELLALRQVIEETHVDPDIERYIVRLVDATRRDKRVAVGASPRGSLALLKLARVQAALEGRAYVLPDDVKSFVRPALIHRLILTPDCGSAPRGRQRAGRNHPFDRCAGALGSSVDA